MLLPLAVLGLGLWEASRAEADLAATELNRARAAKAVSLLESRPAPANGRPDFGAQFRRNGQTYAGPLALDQARDALGDAERAVTLSHIRGHLPPLVMLAGGLAAALSVTVLLAAALLGRAGRASREALLRGFSLARRALPGVLGAQVVLFALGVVGITGFEALGILEADNLSSGGAKLLGILALVIGASLWIAGKAVFQLRRALDLFAPDPLPILGRPVTPDEAPGLWRLLDDLAGRLGALRPDNVVVGLTGGFFVSSGPKVLEPGGAALGGRTLYLPLPYLPLLREDEVATIIGHELAHFSGGDTEYSLRFVPIYAGVSRSLDAVVTAGADVNGSVSPLIRPALNLGIFVMDQFHHAVRHWSRLREFAADAAGASVTSADASARALLRTSAIHPRIEAVLDAAAEAPASAPPDLVDATLRLAAEQGLDDPAKHLEEEQPHPTDTHPPTRQRIAALGREPDAALLAEAAAPPPPPSPGAMSRLSALFAAPEALCRAATEDFLAVVRSNALARRNALEAAAAGVAPDATVLGENTRGGGIFLLCFGGILAVAILFVMAVDVPGFGPTEKGIVCGSAGVLALVFLVAGYLMLRRHDRTFLVLRPEALEIPGLDRPIAWADVADLDMTMDRGSIITRMLLPPQAPFPTRLPGAGRRVKLDTKQRIVTLRSGLPCGMKPEGLAELIGRYRQADLARRLLAEERAADQNEAAHVTGV
ncbi:M48 family metallopeptidase [Roseomonas populi]|uniref:M48 family metalloprotease n=1 Tax=Roseomonas populi TaxID=3121582 RepID=A0ABT1X049_9PROT|nr:M48 family metallopeptidase [Roseomonas pecuniae]MCR0981475.1 M48 family metalloprotease [Roseomonas pecuniae]